MPIIKLKQPELPVAQFSFTGTTVTIEDVTIDCAAEQDDSKKTIEVRLNNGKATTGEEGAYLAVIEIPAKEYTAPSGEAESIAQAIPLDPNSVTVTLWPTV